MTRTRNYEPQRRLRGAALCVLGSLCPRSRVVARAGADARRSACRPRSCKAAIAKLGDLDYATRTTASRTVRRTASAQAVPALMQAVVRAGRRLRSLSRARPADRLQRSAHAETRCANRSPVPNDRLRTVAYSFFEHNPDRALLPQFLTALEKEQAEFVRPALVRALAALAATRTTTSLVRVRRCCARSSRGEDFFRSAVIEALGDYKAQYAFDALIGRRQARRAAAGRCGAGARARSATSARSTRSPAIQRPRRRPRSRRSPPRSACSTSTASRTRAISSTR